MYYHKSVEALQNLIVRRICNNGVSRTEILNSWKKIQRNINKEIRDAEVKLRATVVGSNSNKL